jgi:hypothetical protein
MLPWIVENSSNLRIIKTARTLNAINMAAESGFFPLIKLLNRNPQITSKLAIFQHKTKHTIQVISDSRETIFRNYSDDSPYTLIVNWTPYYPYLFESPYAAYLIPPDIKLNETVYIEDLIEDIVGAVWAQGCAYRQIGGIATWDGENFNIHPRISSKLYG